MPCACFIPLAAAPTSYQWGPLLWKILHTLSEKYGTTLVPLFEAEETVSWLYIINNTGIILPCKECKTHYAIWLQSNPPQFKAKSIEEKRQWVRNYFWSLHQDINLRNGKEGIPFKYLSTLYKSVDISNNIILYEKLLETLIQYNEVSLIKWKEWLKHVKKLLSIYG